MTWCGLIPCGWTSRQGFKRGDANSYRFDLHNVISIDIHVWNATATLSVPGMSPRAWAFLLAYTYAVLSPEVKQQIVDMADSRVFGITPQDTGI